MANTEKFEGSLISGNIGEDVAYNFLRHNAGIRTIYDVSKDKQYQEEDVDFIVITTDYKLLKIEVKHDMKADRTGNICYELTSNGNIGCLARSQADYVFYITYKYIYIIQLNKWRNYIEKANLKEINMGDGATGYLCNSNELVNEKIAIRKERNDEENEC